MTHAAVRRSFSRSWVSSVRSPGRISHLSFTVPLACPLVTLAAQYVSERLGRPAGILVSALVIGLCVLAVAHATKRRMDVVAEPLETIATARGPVVRRAGPWTTDFAQLMATLDHVPPADPIFFYPYIPMLPYLDRKSV